MLDESQSIDGLCIPRLSSEIPLSMVSHGLASLYNERHVLGLPTIYPDCTVHKSIDAVLIKNLKALGFEPNKFTEQQITFGLHLGCEPYEFDDEDKVMQSHFVVTLDQANKCVYKALDALDAASNKLGEYIWYFLKETDVNRLPGVVTPNSIFQLYVDFRLESETSDEEAMELLASWGVDDEEIQSMLPSYIQNKLGGSRIFEPRKPPKSFSLLKSLDKVGVPQAARLAELIQVTLPTAIQKYEDAIRCGIPYRCEYRMSSFRLTASEHHMPHAVDQFLDECLEDMANNGDPQDDLLLQRVGVNAADDGTFLKPHDGLAALAKLFNAYTVLDEIISRLLDIPAEMEIKNETNTTRKSKPGAKQCATPVRGKRRSRSGGEPALRQ